MERYLSVTQYALKHQKDAGNIRHLLLNGRLHGIKIGNQWAIKEDEPYPKDERISSGLYFNQRQKAKIKSNKELMDKLNPLFYELSLIYGESMTSIVIYGSYARGTQEDESDIDIAVFLDKQDKENTRKMLVCVSKYELETGKVLSVIEIDNKQYCSWKEVVPFYKNISKEGITLWKKK